MDPNNPIDKLRQLKSKLDSAKTQPQNSVQAEKPSNPAYKYFDPSKAVKKQPEPGYAPLVTPQAANQPVQEPVQTKTSPKPDKSFLENAADGLAVGWEQMKGSTARGLAEVMDIGSTAPTIGDYAGVKNQKSFEDYTELKRDQAAGKAKSVMPSWTEYADKRKAEADKMITDRKADPESWGYMVGSILPQGAGIATAVGVGALNPLAGAAIGAASTGQLTSMAIGGAAEEYDDYVKETGQEYDANARLGSMMLSAAAESVSEAIPVAKFIPKGFRGKMGKFLFGNTDVTSKTGKELLDQFANTNASRKQLVKNVLREMGEGALTEGPTEAVAELGGEFSSWLYKEKEDRATWQEMAERAGKAVVGGSIMGAGIGPMSYGAQQVQNSKRRQQAGKVILAQDKKTGEAVEIMGMANADKDGAPPKDTAIQYQAIRPNGKIYEVDENQLDGIIDLPLEDFNGILKGRGKALSEQETNKLNQQTQQAQSEADTIRTQYQELSFQGEDGTPQIAAAKFNGEDVFVTNMLPDGSAVIQRPGEAKRVVKQSGLTEMDVQPFDAFMQQFAPQAPQATETAFNPANPIQVGEETTIEGASFVVTGFDPESGTVRLENSEDGSDLPTLSLEQYQAIRQPKAPESSEAANQLRDIFQPKPTEATDEDTVEAGNTVDLGGVETEQTKESNKLPKATPESSQQYKNISELIERKLGAKFDFAPIGLQNEVRTTWMKDFLAKKGGEIGQDLADIIEFPSAALRFLNNLPDAAQATTDTTTEQSQPETAGIPVTESTDNEAQPPVIDVTGQEQPIAPDAPAESTDQGIDSEVSVESQPVNNPNKLDDPSLEEYFELDPAKNINDVDANIEKVLSQYSGRVMGKVQVFRYLTELGELGKQWAQEKGISSKDELDKWAEKAQTKARSGKGKEKQESRKTTRQQKTDFNVDQIEQLALKAEDDFLNQNQTTPTNEPIQQAEPLPEAGQDDVQVEENKENSPQEVQGQEGVDGSGVAKEQPKKKPSPKKKPRKKTPEQIRKQEVLDREPSTASGYARKWLLTGGKLSSVQSSENKQKGVGIGKGVRDETGMSGREMSSLIGIIDNRNGLSPEVAAERIHETLSEEQADRIGVQDLRNALIDVLLSENRKDWVNNQDAETKEVSIDEYGEWVKNQLTPEEIAEKDAEMQTEAYWEDISQKIDELAKQYDEFVNSEEYQQYIEEIYGQVAKSSEDGRNQSNEENNRKEAEAEPVAGTDGNRIDAGGERQDPDSPNPGSQGKPEPKPATGTGNDSGKSFLSPKGDFSNELQAAKESNLSENGISTIEGRGLILNSIRKDFPQLTDLHENEINTALKGGIKPEALAKLIFGKVNDFSFNPKSPLNLSNQKAAKPVTKKAEIEKQIDSIKKRVAELRKQPGNKPEAKQEIAVLTKEVNRLIQQLDQAMGKEQAAAPAQQEDLFAAPKDEPKQARDKDINVSAEFEKSRDSVKKIVLDEGSGTSINDIHDQWTKIKDDNDQKAWNEKVKNTKFGTYGTKPFFEVLDEFNPKMNEVSKSMFYRDLESALDIPQSQSRYPQEKIGLDGSQKPKPKTGKELSEAVLTASERIKQKAEQQRQAEKEPKTEAIEEVPQDGRPDFSKDISYERAKRAYQAISFDPEKRGKAEVKGHIEYMNSVWEELKALATSPQQVEVFLAEFDRVRKGVIDRRNALLDAKSRTMSSMITGPARFPVSRNQKALDVENKRLNELLDYQKQAIDTAKKRIKQAATPEQKQTEQDEATEKLSNSIKKDIASLLVGIKYPEDYPYAVPLIKAGIARKIANLTLPTNPEAGKKVLEWANEEAKKLGVKPIFTEKHQVYKYIETAEQQKAKQNEPQPASEAAPEEVLYDSDVVKITRDPSIDRILVQNPDIPSKAIRDQLKSAGWRWSPTNKAWQRKNTREAVESAKRIFGITELNPDDARLLIIGGRGASKLDQSQQTDTRLNHWRLAKQMEKYGEPADAIRLSTGWERGADGKWRYEIQDGEWKDVDKVLELMLGDSDQTVKLSDIYDNKEFYEAYPEAGDIQVTFSPEGDGAFFDANETSITLQGSEFRKRFKGKPAGDVLTGTNDLRGLRSVLAHELTHYIQEKEFFAKGASPKFFEDMQALSEEMRTEFLSYTDDIDLVISEAEARNISISEAFKLATGVFEPKAEKQVARYVEEYKDKPLSELKKRVKEDRNYLRSPLEKYYAAMGEAEARNVQNRLDMTPWERLVNTIESTEYDPDKNSIKNVAREDQIKITKGGISKSVEPTTAPDLTNLVTGNRAQELIKAPDGKPTKTTQEIAAKAAKFTEGWANAPEIVTVNSAQEALDRYPELAAKYTLEDIQDVPAVFIKNPETGKSQALLIASHSYLSEKGGVEKAILHEVIGHYGVREFLKQQAKGDKAKYFEAYKALMTEVFEAKKNNKHLADIAKRYFNKPVDQLNETERLIVADEYIAHLAQEGITDKWIDRVVAKLRQILRQLGITVGMNDAEIRALIGNSMRIVQGPQGKPVLREGIAQESAPKFMVQEDNSGDFNLDNSDIRFLRTGDSTQIEAARKESWYQQFKNNVNARRKDLRYAVQDSMIGGKKMLQARYGKMASVPDRLNYYVQENLFRDKIFFLENQYKNKFQKPLKELTDQIQKAYGLKIEDVDNYLMARHNEERRRKIFTDKLGKIKNGDWKVPAGMVRKLKAELKDKIENVDTFLADLQNTVLEKRIAAREKLIERYMKDLESEFPTGMKQSEANEIIKNFETKVSKEEVKSLTDQIKAINQESLRIREEAGILSAKGVEVLKNQYQNYVPLRGLGENISEDETVFSPLMKANGRSSRASSPIAYLHADMMDAIHKAEHNKVLQSFLQYVKENVSSKISIEGFYLRKVTDEDGNEIWEELSEGSKPSKEDLESGAVKRGFDPEAMERAKFDSNTSDSTITVMVNGQKVKIRMDKDPHSIQLALTLKKKNTPELGAFLRINGKFNRFWAQLVTTYSPEFGQVNFSRDATLGAFRMFTMDGGKVMVNSFYNLPKAMNNLRKVFYNDMDLAGISDQFTKEYFEQGAFTGYNVQESVSEIYKEFSQLKGSARRSFLRKLFKEHPQKALDLLNVYNSTIENGLRLAYFTTLRKLGVSPQKAASKAKDLTVNFRRKGNNTNQINSLFAFFNASIQGSSAFLEPFVGEDLASRKRAWGLTSGLYTMGFMQAMLWGLLGYDEEEDESPYDNISEYERNSNIIIPVGGGNFMKIPIGFGPNIPYAMGEMTASYILGKASIEDNILRFMSLLTNTFSPVGGYDFNSEQTSEQQIIRNLTPTIAKPAVDVAINKNFLGYQIYPEKIWDKNKPDSHNFKKSTSEVAKYIASGLNTATGGTQFESGLADFSPDVMEYYFRQYLGGPGNFMNKNLISGENLLIKEENPFSPDNLNKVPFVSRFFTNPQNSRTVMRQFYEFKKEAEEFKDLYEKYENVGDIENRDRIAKDKLFLLDSYYYLKGYGSGNDRVLGVEDYIKDLNKHIEYLTANEGTRESIQELENQKLFLMQDFVDEYKATNPKKPIRRITELFD